MCVRVYVCVWVCIYVMDDSIIEQRHTKDCFHAKLVADVFLVLSISTEKRGRTLTPCLPLKVDTNCSLSGARLCDSSELIYFKPKYGHCQEHAALSRLRLPFLSATDHFLLFVCLFVWKGCIELRKNRVLLGQRSGSIIKRATDGSSPAFITIK